MWDTRVADVESFHLAFLAALAKRLGAERFVLKGGANLRYFFHSVRYSEDVDIDVAPNAHSALEPKVDALLGGRQLDVLLRTTGLSVREVTKPKQSPTTHRWKVVLQRHGQAEPVRTKVEFSSRSDKLDGAIVEAVPRRIVAPYGLSPPVLQHYAADAALEQKILALGGRSETQARDVFDLDLLLRSHELPAALLGEHERVTAADRAMALPEDAFRDQVLAFIEDDAVALYEGEWHTMVDRVVAALVPTT